MSGERTQKFGGFWSLLKVEAGEKYLHAYAIAMSKQSFELVYIDTFAGSGSFTFGEGMPLMGDAEAARVFAGSVKRALAIKAFKEAFVMRRLQGIFPHVERPARLLGTKKAPLFNLFFAMANPSAAAKKVASPIARHLLNAI